MKHLKITSAGFEAYTGNLGGIDFIDGVSTFPVPRLFANRLTSAMQMVELDDDGNEVEAGVAARLVSEAGNRAPVLELLERQTEAEKLAENLEAIKNPKNEKDLPVHTRAELETILGTSGIKGLRTIGDDWNVKHKSAVVLLDLILKAQQNAIEVRQARIAAAVEMAEAEAKQADEDSDAHVEGSSAPEDDEKPVVTDGAA